MAREGSGAPQANGSVFLDGNADKLYGAYQKARKGAGELQGALKEAGKAWDTQAEAAKRMERALYVANARMENAKARAADLDRVFGKAGQQATIAANGITRVGTAAGHGQGPMKAFGSAVHNVSAGQSSLSQAVNMVLSSFGPWGMVIGAAATGLVHLAMKQGEAEKAARKATAEIRQQVAALKDLSKEARLQELNKAQLESQDTGFFGRTDEAKAADEKVKAIRREIKRLEEDEALHKRSDAAEAGFRADQERKGAERVARQQEELHELDKQIAVAKSVGFSAKDVHALELTRMRTQAEFLHGEEKAALLREVELKELTGIVATEKKRTKEKETQYKNALAHAGFVKQDLERVAAMQHRAKFGDFDAAVADMQASGLRRPQDKEGQIAESQRAANDTLRTLEAERAQDRSFNLAAELERIELEKGALLSLNELKISLATTGGERDALYEERAQIRHESEMQRLQAEQTAEAEKQKMIGKGIDVAEKAATTAVMSALSTADARRQATMAARLQGKTEAEAARAGKIAALEAQSATLKSIRDMAAVQALQQAAMSIAAFARYDFVAGGLHLAAAGAFGALALGASIGSRSKSDQAFGMQMQDAGLGGGAGFGKGAPGGAANGPNGGSANTGPSPIDSEIPGSPTPKPKGFWQQSSAQNGPTFQNCSFYGTPKRDFIRQITEGQRDLGYAEPKRSA